MSVVVGPERHDRVDFKHAGSDEGRHFQNRTRRRFVRGLDEQARSGRVATLPNLPYDPGLAKIADQACLGFHAAMEIDVAGQLRAAAGQRQELHGLTRSRNPKR